MTYKSKEAKAKYQHNYYLKHKEKFKQYRNDWNRKNPDKVKAYKLRRKLEVIREYSPLCICISCGFSDIKTLTIDHIKGGGENHKKTNRKEPI